MNDQSARIARRLREIRGSMTQTEFAKKIGGGTTQACVSGWEAGKFRPGLASLARIGAATGADLNDLIRMAAGKKRGKKS
ncbi:MAG: helix-turn-helix transcriptional regulator [Patescibacteria group bacterium]